MNELYIVKAALSLGLGLFLGFLNFHLFEKSVDGILSQGENKGVRKLAVKAGLFRHVFIFLAGITLIRAAGLPPIHLCGGLLVSVFVYRIRLFKRRDQMRGENIE